MSGTVNDVAEDEAKRPERGAHGLVVGLECDRPSSGGARYSLDQVVEVTLGRGPKREALRSLGPGGTKLELRLPAPSMSTLHARLVRSGGEWAVEDLGSTNGTFVNGTRVVRTFVGPGDRMTIGRTILLLTAPRETPGVITPDFDPATEPARGGHVTLDPELEELLGQITHVARSKISLLVRGETGSGKEVLARSVHAMSGRSGAFVAVNCGAIPAPLVESQLFGHVKGAFSGAVSSEEGMFRAADRGTLFLDEIGDLAAPAQAALLRALQEREVVPVGATRPIKLDLRVIAATHQPLEDMVGRKAFREDLFARLTGFIAELPPLRARRVDLGVIIATLLRDLAPGNTEIRFTPAAAEAIFRYDWPRNARELEQCLSRALVLAADQPIDIPHLPAALTQKATTTGTTSSGLRPRDEQLRRELLEQLARQRGNLASVARAMGKARMQVHRWCRRFGIDPNLYRD